MAKIELNASSDIFEPTNSPDVKQIMHPLNEKVGKQQLENENEYKSAKSKLEDTKLDTERILSPVAKESSESEVAKSPSQLDEADAYFYEKQMNLFSFEEPELELPPVDLDDSVTKDFQRNGEFVNPNIQFIFKNRDLPVIFENDDEQMEEQNMKELHERLKKERELRHESENDSDDDDESQSDDNTRSVEAQENDSIGDEEIHESFEEIQYLY